jgi:hypothetical protein
MSNLREEHNRKRFKAEKPIFNMVYQVRRAFLLDKIDKISEEYNLDKSQAFLRLCYSTLFDRDIDDIEPEDIIEGCQDKQMDIIKVIEGEDYCDIYIIQCTYEEGFSSNKLTCLKNGLKWVFQKPKEEYLQLDNTRLISKIKEIRETQTKRNLSNINLKVYFITTGDDESLSKEFIQELKDLGYYNSVGYSSFESNIWGSNKFVEYLNYIESTDKIINQKINIVHDTNRGSLIDNSIGEYRGVICTIRGEELARLISEDSMKVIFNKNIRKYLGESKKINRSIYDSCIDSEEGRIFWFLNNGITMVCDSFEINLDPDNPHIKVKDLQIVNGCQTSMTIFKAKERGELNKDVQILLRVYATSKDTSKFTDKITLTTNNQNKIGFRDLKANDSIQIDLQKVFLDKYGYYYERKVNEYKEHRIDLSKKINNERVAQSFLSFGRKQPSIAKSKPNYIWGNDKYYDSVFKNSTTTQLLFCYKIYEYCNKFKKDKLENYKVDDNLYSTITYGLFHIVRIMGFLILKSDSFPKDEELDLTIINLDSEQSILEQAYLKSLKILNDILDENSDKFTSPTNFYKSNEIQEIINKKLKNIFVRESTN